MLRASLLLALYLVSASSWSAPVGVEVATSEVTTYRVVGHITDATTGEPVSGCGVEIEQLHDQEGHPLTTVAQSQTDAQGCFEFSHLPSNDTYLVSIETTFISVSAIWPPWKAWVTLTPEQPTAEVRLTTIPEDWPGVDATGPHPEQTIPTP